jgi:hypothetical protein
MSLQKRSLSRHSSNSASSWHWTCSNTTWSVAITPQHPAEWHWWFLPLTFTHIAQIYCCWCALCKIYSRESWTQSVNNCLQAAVHTRNPAAAEFAVRYSSCWAFSQTESPVVAPGCTLVKFESPVDTETVRTTFHQGEKVAHWSHFTAKRLLISKKKGWSRGELVVGL